MSCLIMLQSIIGGSGFGGVNTKKPNINSRSSEDADISLAKMPAALKLPVCPIITGVKIDLFEGIVTGMLIISRAIHYVCVLLLFHHTI